MDFNYEFKISQNVKIFDDDDEAWIYGKVIDTTMVSVIIKWNDLTDPCKHNREEYSKIKVIQP